MDVPTKGLLLYDESEHALHFIVLPIREKRSRAINSVEPTEIIASSVFDCSGKGAQGNYSGQEQGNNCLIRLQMQRKRGAGQLIQKYAQK